MEVESFETLEIPSANEIAASSGTSGDATSDTANTSDNPSKEAAAMNEAATSAEGATSEDAAISDETTSNELTRDRKSKLLHHLVDISRVLQQEKPDAKEVEQLIKANGELITQILDWPVVNEDDREIVHSVVWKDVLMQKLIDAKVNLADEDVNAFANDRLQATSKSIEALIDKLVCETGSFNQLNGKVIFEMQPNSFAVVPPQNIYQRGLQFTICLKTNPIDLTITCNNIPAGKSCKAVIQAAINDKSGKALWVRTFSRVFDNAYYAMKTFTVNSLIRGEEYQDEALGLLKEGKMKIELSIQAGELETAPEKPKPTVVYKVASSNDAVVITKP